ncbi:MAG: hypothetical protein GJ680_04075 [Alteromonadaceae bacterium]|nr:hypothetical protein [Alteromonadaceae bacterium]
MLNLLLTLLASTTLLVGSLSMLTPIPGGTIVIAVSLTVLIYTSPTARWLLRKIRSNFHVNNLFAWIELKVGQRFPVIGDALARTRPYCRID